MNKSPSTAIGCQTPEEVWLGNIVDYSISWISSYPYYVQVSNGKLNGRVRNYMFLGYA